MIRNNQMHWRHILLASATTWNIIIIDLNSDLYKNENLYNVRIFEKFLNAGDKDIRVVSSTK